MTYRMKGHTLPGINQKIDKSTLPDGRAKSSAMQKNVGVGATNSEKAKADGASEKTVRKLEEIEKGNKKKSELIDPVKINRVEAKLKELQPKKTK